MVVSAFGYTYTAFERNGSVILNKLPEVQQREIPVLYSLFMRVQGRWNRVRTTAYPYKIAVRIWSDTAIYNPENFSIRPVKIDSLEAR